MIVLDTHAWIWWCADRARIPPTLLAAPLATKDEKIRASKLVTTVW